MKSTVETHPYAFTELIDRTTKRMTVRDTVETNLPVKYVQDMEVFFDGVTASRDGNSMKLDTSADVNILFVAEDGGIYTASKKLPVALRLEAPEKCDCRVRVTPAAEAFSAAATSGAEVRFDACFELELSRKSSIAAVSAVKLEAYEANAPLRPSVVLKYPAEGESLWSMAKRYNTTEDDIRAANDLEGDRTPDSSKLLLIPKRR